jgi:signal transduction histidine kinase
MPVVAWSPLAVTLAAITLVGVAAASADVIPSDQVAFAWGVGGIGLIYVVIGGLVSSRKPRHPIGWILSAIGVGQTANLATGAWWHLARVRSLPGAELALWFGSWNWIPSVGLLVTFLILLFPTGRPPSPRWRPIGWLAAAGIVTAVAPTAFEAWRVRSFATPDTEIPLNVLTGAGLGIVLLAAAGSVASLIVRRRRAAGEERQQLRWFAAAAVVTLVGLLLSLSIPVPWSAWFIGPGFIGLAAATGIAILKYRLWDLDVVIRKTVVAGVLVVLLAGISLLVLAIAGRLVVGPLSDRPEIFLATGIVVGLLALPLLRLSRKVADRIVYGRRATPFEVLTEFSGRMAVAYAADDVLPRMAQVLAAGIGAEHATVWLRVGDELHAVASSPVGQAAEPLPVEDDRVPDVPGEDAFEVRHQGELLGTMTVRLPPSDPMDPGKGRLVRGLASQAGLVLRNVRLLEDLRASRRRLVAAQDEERRRLERNIHDGLQQQLVALNVRLGLLARTTSRDPEAAAEVATALQDQVTGALEELRDLARGIYPPLLAEQGLIAALEAQARRAAVPTVVASDGVGRYPREIESAVYFSCLEALNNSAKYADARRVEISLRERGETLEFTATDDGRGFDPEATRYGTGLQGMTDRLEAIGGRLEITSAPGGGTTVRGTIPANREVPA